MKIGFIGAGKVGCSFGKYLRRQGLDISGFFSRNVQNSQFAADFTESVCFGDLELFIRESDIIFITVNDGAISDVWKQLSCENLNRKIICHCSGAVSSDVHLGALDRGAYPCSVHPMLAVSDKKSFDGFAKAFFTVEGNSFACGEIKKILNSIGNQVKIIDEPQKKTLYHLACVFQSNFVNAVVSKGIDFLKDCGFSEAEALLASSKLISENVKNVLEKGISKSLTGPVERCDLSTVEKHIDILEGKDAVIYKLLSLELTKIAESLHHEVCYDEMKKILEVVI